MSRRAVSFHLCAGMNSELASPCLRNGDRIFKRQCFFRKAKAHLGADRNAVRHRTAHSGHNLMEPFGPLQKCRPGVMAVHGLRGAAKIDINSRRAKLGGKGRVLCHHMRFPAHDLYVHRHPCRGFAALFQLRAERIKDMGGIKMLAHTHEFRHTQIETTNPRQNIAHIDIDDPLHWGQRYRCQDCLSSIFLIIF